MSGQDLKIDDAKLRDCGIAGKASKIIVAVGVSTNFANTNSRITTTLTPAGSIEVGDRLRVLGSAAAANNGVTTITNIVDASNFDVAATLTDASSETTVSVTRLPRG